MAFKSGDLNERRPRQLTALKLQYFDTLKKDKKIEDCNLIKSNPNAITYFKVEDNIPLKISPNPVDESLNLYGDFNTATSITITNLMGQVAYSHAFVESASSQIESINLAHLPSGIYLITIRQEGSQVVKTFWKN